MLILLRARSTTRSARHATPEKPHCIAGVPLQSGSGAPSTAMTDIHDSGRHKRALHTEHHTKAGTITVKPRMAPLTTTNRASMGNTTATTCRHTVARHMRTFRISAREAPGWTSNIFCASSSVICVAPRTLSACTPARCPSADEQFIKYALMVLAAYGIERRSQCALVSRSLALIDASDCGHRGTYQRNCIARKVRRKAKEVSYGRGRTGGGGASHL